MTESEERADTAAVDEVTGIWGMAWRSGAGSFATMAAVRGSGLVLAQVTTPSEVSSWLLAVTAIEALSTMSQVPLHTTLPTLARLHARGERHAQVDLAKRRFRLSMWIFVSGALGVGAFADTALSVIGSNIAFVAFHTWALLAVGFFFHRYGALHVQLYSLTNNILSHVGDGVATVVAALVAWVFYPLVGVVALPLGFLAGYAGFYTGYAARRSYREFRFRMLEFEPTVSVAPLATLVIGLLSTWH
jgi:O-antigen/teichoic acid export membrane protein